MQPVPAGGPLDHAAAQADDVVYPLLVQEAANLRRAAAGAAIDDDLLKRFGELIELQRHHVHRQGSGVGQDAAFDFRRRANIEQFEMIFLAQHSMQIGNADFFYSGH